MPDKDGRFRMTLLVPDLPWLKERYPNATREMLREEAKRVDESHAKAKADKPASDPSLSIYGDKAEAVNEWAKRRIPRA